MKRLQVANNEGTKKTLAKLSQMLFQQSNRLEVENGGGFVALMYDIECLSIPKAHFPPPTSLVEIYKCRHQETWIV
jgi:hypothetical protein